MSILKKMSALSLSLAMACGFFTIYGIAGDNKKSSVENRVLNDFPFVFVHGFNGWGSEEGLNKILPYWGATCGNLNDYLLSNGYESYSASVGPFSSAWDRACELYAQLTGTTVDYGAHHSAEFNHSRYGRTYEKPLFEGWGRKDENDNIKKVHLIGHSFGGTTIRLFAYLMTYGCPEEVNASPGDASPLFTGGKENWIQSVTTICTPHNSSDSYYFAKDFRLYEPLINLSTVYAAVLGRSPLNGTVVDFHLEQFGLTNTPGEHDSDDFITSVKRFSNGNDDSCQRDLCPDRMKELNDKIKISKNIYYFSYAFDTTNKDPVLGLRWPILTTNPVILPISIWIGHHKTFIDGLTGQVYDDEWKANDALCNTISETYPFDEPHKDFDENTINPGVWNVMPVQKGDHGTAIGLLANKKNFQKFYDSIAVMLKDTEKER
ncbi:MAG: hypothetical protein K6F64_09915 [Clostridia bacterium]|nr:hypothetical protein [Clostridia bacterium]